MELHLALHFIHGICQTDLGNKTKYGIQEGLVKLCFKRLCCLGLMFCRLRGLGTACAGPLALWGGHVFFLGSRLGFCLWIGFGSCLCSGTGFALGCNGFWFCSCAGLFARGLFCHVWLLILILWFWSLLWGYFQNGTSTCSLSTGFAGILLGFLFAISVAILGFLGFLAILLSLCLCSMLCFLVLLGANLIFPTQKPLLKTFLIFIQNVMSWTTISTNSILRSQLNTKRFKIPM